MTQPTIYLSAQYGRKDEMNRHAAVLRAAGYGIVSRWHSGVEQPDDALTDDLRAVAAAVDEADIERAGVVIVFGDDPGDYRGQGGRDTELGIAIALRVPVIWCGPRSGVFPFHDHVTHVATFDDALAELAMWGRRAA